MTSFGPETYGESFADVYDQWYGQISDAEATADFLSHRCQDGPVLELGVGTGRLALPIIERGHPVVGLDASPAMLSRCSSSVSRVLGDMAALPFHALSASPKFGAVLCGFNTLFNLSSEQAQFSLLRQLAPCLAEGAPLIVEAITGLPGTTSSESSLGVSRIDGDRLVLSATKVDAAAQTIAGQHVDITEEGIRLRPWFLRWTTPEQLDKLASRAGLELCERYATWDQEVFGPESDMAISVYQRHR